MAEWFGAHYNQEVHFSAAVKWTKGPKVLTSLLNQRQNYYYKLWNVDSKHSKCVYRNLPSTRTTEPDYLNTFIKIG